MICGRDRSGWPGSGPASGSPSTRRSPRLSAGRPDSARTRAACGSASSSGSGLVMPGWFGPSHELQRSNICWSAALFGGSLWKKRQSGVAVSDARRMWPTSSTMLIESVCQKK